MGTLEQKRTFQRKQPGRAQFLALGVFGFGLIILGLLALILLPKGKVASGSSQPGAIPVPVNYPAPDLTLMDLSGKKVSLADFKGSVVLVNNWATWCPPCKDEMPVLQAYDNAHAAQGFATIAVEAGEPPGQVAEFANSLHLAFHVWPDPGMRSVAAFKNMSLPNTYIIDRTGTVRLAWTGAVTEKTLEKYVTPIILE